MLEIGQHGAVDMFVGLGGISIPQRDESERAIYPIQGGVGGKSLFQEWRRQGHIVHGDKQNSVVADDEGHVGFFQQELVGRLRLLQVSHSAIGPGNNVKLLYFIDADTFERQGQSRFIFTGFHGAVGSLQTIPIFL